jgi:hypothetical protein
MRKIVTLLSLFVFIASSAKAQTLSFSQALIVSSSVETVPNDKVWKLTSAYGEYEGCAGYFNNDYNGLRYKQAILTDFFVNGVKINVVRENLFNNSVAHFSLNTCSGSSSTSNQNWNYAIGNRSASPVIFPMWIPAGTTVNTGGSTVKLSVLEFNVIP